MVESGGEWWREGWRGWRVVESGGLKVKKINILKGTVYCIFADSCDQMIRNCRDSLQITNR